MYDFYAVGSSHVVDSHSSWQTTRCRAPYPPQESLPIPTFPHDRTTPAGHRPADNVPSAQSLPPSPSSNGSRDGAGHHRERCRMVSDPDGYTHHAVCKAYHSARIPYQHQRHTSAPLHTVPDNRRSSYHLYSAELLPPYIDMVTQVSTAVDAETMAEPFS